MQPCESEFALRRGDPGRILDPDEDPAMYISVWSSPGELGVPYDDIDADQPDEIHSVSQSVSFSPSEKAKQSRACNGISVSTWANFLICLVTWPLAIYSWYRFNDRSFADVQWQLRTCTLLGLIDRPGCCTISVEVNLAQAQSESPQPALSGSSGTTQQFSVPSPAEGGLDLVTVQACSSNPDPRQSACDEVVASAGLQSQYRCYVQSENDKSEGGHFTSADSGCLKFGAYSLVDAVPAGQTQDCTQKFAKNTIHTNSSVGVLENRTAHVATLCVAILATVGLLIHISLCARSRRAAGSSTTANSSHARAISLQVQRGTNRSKMSYTQEIGASDANYANMSHQQFVPHPAGLVDTRGVPEIQVADQMLHLAESRLSVEGAWSSQRRRSI
eukprot:jgi/Ulvmu1/12495/UM009_0148.1